MTKSELLSKLSKKTGATKGQVEEVLNALSETISEDVFTGGDKVVIPGLGMFKQKVTEARMGRNPSTNTAMNIPAKTKVTFRPVKA